MGRAAGVPDAKLANLNRWQESDVFSLVERQVLEYAEALTRTPVDHRPDLHAALLEHMTQKQLTELTTTIAWENFRARFNRAYDVQAQGFSTGSYCVLPDRHPPPSEDEAAPATVEPGGLIDSDPDGSAQGL